MIELTCFLIYIFANGICFILNPIFKNKYINWYANSITTTKFKRLFFKTAKNNYIGFTTAIQEGILDE